jgi:hypothetical protein
MIIIMVYQAPPTSNLDPEPLIPIRYKASALGVSGFIKYVSEVDDGGQGGALEGEIEGTSEGVGELKNWLFTVGSPASMIQGGVVDYEEWSEERLFEGFRVYEGSAD